MIDVSGRAVTRVLLSVCALALLVVAAAAFMVSCGQQRPRAAPMSAATPAATELFAVIKPGGTPGQVLVARATEYQPGGPETLVPVHVQPYRAMRLAPGAVIRITAPLYPGVLTDWIKGAQVTPQQFDADARQAEARWGPLPDRAHMFHLTLDAQGRVSRMQHYFSP